MNVILNILLIGSILSINAMDNQKKPLRKIQSSAPRLMKDNKKPLDTEKGMPLRAWIAQNKQTANSGTIKKALAKSTDEMVQDAIEFLKSIELEISGDDVEVTNEN